MYLEHNFIPTMISTQQKEKLTKALAVIDSALPKKVFKKYTIMNGKHPVNAEISFSRLNRISTFRDVTFVTKKHPDQPIGIKINMINNVPDNNNIDHRAVIVLNEDVCCTVCKKKGIEWVFESFERNLIVKPGDVIVIAFICTNDKERQIACNTSGYVLLADNKSTADK